MTVSTLRLLVVPLLALLPGLLGACREGDASNFAGSIPITPTVFGSHGCNAPNQAFVAPVSVYSDPAIGPMSQIAAPAGADILYLTGGDASVHELDFSGGVPPVDTVLVASGVFDAALAAIGIAMPAQLSGVAVLDAANLLVVEHTSNTIWLVRLHS